jgi:hypothetical protein
MITKAAIFILDQHILIFIDQGLIIDIILVRKIQTIYYSIMSRQV